MTAAIIVDSSVLIEGALQGRPHHAAVAAALRRFSRRLVIPSLCIAETCHLLERAAGWQTEAAFLDSAATLVVVPVEPEDLRRSAELVRQFHSFPLGGVDASIVALAERLDTDTIMTLDHRHFRAIKPRHCEFFHLLPEL